MLMSHRILVVDDDKDIVRLLRSYLEKEGFTVLFAYDGTSAMHILRRDKPDLLVLDLMLPDKDGWEMTRLIRTDKVLNALPIIMLTARIEDADKIVGLEIGADDYVTKPFNPREVVARVRAQIRRTQLDHNASQPLRLEVGHIVMDTGRRMVTVGGTVVELTPTEWNLLQTFLESPGYAFTRTELIETALGFGYESIERTLDSHIKNLRRKIEPDPKEPTYIQTVYGVGYRLSEI